MADALEASSIIAIVAAVLSAVLKIACLVGVGVKLELQGMLNGPKRKCLSALAMDVCLPCLLFGAVLPEADIKLLEEGWQLLLWPFVYASVGAVIGSICCLAVGTPWQHLGAAAACAAFPNVNGFPVSIISALGTSLPKSPAGFTPMVFLALVQLTDGLVKYTVGPAVFRRDLRAVQRFRAKMGQEEDFPLGASLRTIEPVTPPSLDEPDRQSCDHPPNGTLHLPKMGCSLPKSTGDTGSLTEFGLLAQQVCVVEPEWSRFDSYKSMWPSMSRQPSLPHRTSGLQSPLLSTVAEATTRPGRNIVRQATEHFRTLAFGAKDFLRHMFPPQVVAVIVAISIGLAPPWLKHLMLNPDAPKDRPPPLGFVYGTACQLGGGFVPLQMISLGGRLVNVVGESGPLATSGAAGPRGRTRLVRIGAAVGVARMVIAPFALYGVARVVDYAYLQRSRPMAFWAPGLIVAAMPTANNMSTMADLIGSGRSISAASTALQLIASPLVLAVTLSVLIAEAEQHLAADLSS